MTDQIEDKSDEITVEDSIRDAIKELEGKQSDTDETPEDKVKQPEIKEEVVEKTEVEKTPEVKQVKPFPEAYNKHEAVKAKWAELPVEVQEALLAREQDIQKGLSRFDEDKNFGKQLREVINPYMPIIQAEGGNPTAAVQSLLNSAYILRTGDPVTKATLVQNLIRQYGIDMSIVQDQTGAPKQIDPAYGALLQEINSLKQQVYQNSTLQDSYTNDKIGNEYRVFTENPTNIYKDIVKDDMIALLEKGLAANFQEAYDKAVWMNPQSRSALEQERIAKQLADAETKRKNEIEAKRKASVSVHGNPGLYKPTAPATTQNNSIEDDIRDALRQVREAAY